MPDSGAVRVLVVEDDSALAEVLCDDLRARGHMAVAAPSVSRGLDELKRSDFEVALLGLVLSDGSGVDVLRHIVEEELPTEAIVIAGPASVSTAIDAMTRGAYDYVTKPARREELEALVAKAAEKARLRRETAALRVRLQRYDAADAFVTADETVKDLLATLERVAPSDLPVLLQGETGTGKELFARAVHRLSPRAREPFVTVDCSRVSEDLLEVELFGQEKGAFAAAFGRQPALFEVADGGVLFLDQVDEVAPTLQIKLLRALEAREFVRLGGTRRIRCDVRIVSATHKDLRTETQEGRFREDLYYRLNGVTLKLPPLRDRKADIPLLAEHFVNRSGANARRKLSPRAVSLLLGYAWPGNVRELQMVIQRAKLLSATDTLEPEDLPLDVRDQNWKAAAVRTTMTLAAMERDYIETVLRQNSGHRGKTARALGIDPKTLYNKLGPQRPRRKPAAAAAGGGSR